MADFLFPSGSFPELCRVRLRAPEHWLPAQPPGSVLSLVWPYEEGRFTPNVVVSITRFPAGYHFETAVEALDADLTALPDCQVTIRDRGVLAGVPAYLQEVAFVQEGVGTLVQINLVVLVERGSSVDLVHTVGTAAGDRLEPDYAEVREIVQSLEWTVVPLASSGATA